MKTVPAKEEAIPVVIVPHHLLAASLIAESLKTVADHSYAVIVVISPNHFSRGQKKILTTTANWVTPFGYVTADKDLIAQLTSDDSVGLKTEALRGEHGIGNVLPFIKYLWPDTPVVPLIIKDTQTQADSQRLAKILYDSLPNNTLVILSEDMSHYKSPKVSRLHDATTIQALKNLDGTLVDSLDVDSRPSLRTIFAYLRLRKATHFHLINHSDASLIVKQPLEETTSYITGFYADQ